MTGSSVKILVIGEPVHVAECKARLSNYEVHNAASHHEARPAFAQSSAIFDFIIDEDPSQLHVYTGCKIPVFLNSVKSTLRELTENHTTLAQFFGFNGLPTFFNRPILEATVAEGTDRGALASIGQQLNIPLEIVADQPGMVSARVVCMIVNEAFSAIEDGTATEADIDLAMKLGTNYPRGPVEWGRQIGLRNVCDVLDALSHKTGSQRYAVCDLLRDEARRE